MTQPLSDTNPSVSDVQFQLLRHASPARRVEIAAEMSRFALENTTFALQRRYPHATASEIALLRCAQCYGDDIATRVRAALATRACDDDVS